MGKLQQKLFLNVIWNIEKAEIKKNKREKNHEYSQEV